MNPTAAVILNGIPRSQSAKTPPVTAIRHIAATPTDLLHLMVGNMALSLKAHADGIDERPVTPMSAPAKSYGQQQTFDADLTDEEFAEAVLRRMADDLMAKVGADGKSIRTLTVRVRYNDMAEDQCGESLLEPTDLKTDVYGRILPDLQPQDMIDIPSFIWIQGPDEFEGR